MYASIGRKQTELDRLNAEYDKLLGVVSQIVSGEIHPSRVSVDLAARNWAVAAVNPPPAATADDAAQQPPTGETEQPGQPG